MKNTKIIMGMPITIEITGEVANSDIEGVFKYFQKVDKKFSTYKPTSEISRINKGLPEKLWSQEMKTVLELCEETKKLTKGYFDISHNNKLDPSGLVKGWAIYNAARLLLDKGIKDFYIDAGGDVQVHGTNATKQPWAVGILNPFNIKEIIKVVNLKNQGMATSGTYIRGQHIYNPHNKNQKTSAIKSLTVIGPNIYEADRYATAAFAMGDAGISLINKTKGLEGYMVSSNKTATYTKGFEKYVVKSA